MPRTPYQKLTGQDRPVLEKFLGELELAIMEIVWDRETVTVRDVLTALQAERELAYTTVMTVMHRLAIKGLLTQEKGGKTHHYRAAQTREQFTAGAAGRVVRSLLDDFGELAIAQFVKAVAAADPEQLARLAELARAAQDDEHEPPKNLQD